MQYLTQKEHPRYGTIYVPAYVVNKQCIVKWPKSKEESKLLYDSIKKSIFSYPEGSSYAAYIPEIIDAYFPGVSEATLRRFMNRNGGLKGMPTAAIKSPWAYLIKYKGSDLSVKEILKKEGITGAAASTAAHYLYAKVPRNRKPKTSVVYRDITEQEVTDAIKRHIGLINNICASRGGIGTIGMSFIRKCVALAISTYNPAKGMESTYVGDLLTNELNNEKRRTSMHKSVMRFHDQEDYDNIIEGVADDKATPDKVAEKVLDLDAFVSKLPAHEQYFVRLFLDGKMNSITTQKFIVRMQRYANKFSRLKKGMITEATCTKKVLKPQKAVQSKAMRFSSATLREALNGVTQKEAARKLGISVSTLTRVAKSMGVPCKSTGNVEMPAVDVSAMTEEYDGKVFNVSTSEDARYVLSRLAKFKMGTTVKVNTKNNAILSIQRKIFFRSTGYGVQSVPINNKGLFGLTMLEKGLRPIVRRFGLKQRTTVLLLNPVWPDKATLYSMVKKDSTRVVANKLGVREKELTAKLKEYCINIYGKHKE